MKKFLDQNIEFYIFLKGKNKINLFVYLNLFWELTYLFWQNAVALPDFFASHMIATH